MHLRLLEYSIALTACAFSSASADDLLPGNSEVIFEEAIELFATACIAQGPSYQESEREFRAAGLTVNTITGGLGHASMGLTGRFGGFSAPDGTLVQYCELSAKIPEPRSQLRKSFAIAIKQIDSNAVQRDAETLTSVNEEMLSIYKIESSLASGRATLSVMASFVK